MNLVQRIPGGLISKATETFSIDNEPYTTFNRQIYSFEETPSCRIDIYMDHMKANQKGEKVMEEITGSNDDMVKVKQWMLCRFGGMDDTPDIDEFNRIQEAEYVPCSKRGMCPFEGKGCCTVEVSKDVFLSKAELAVTKLIEDQDKIIADKLCISTQTVKTHIQNIRKKLNKNSRTGVAVWAVVKGII